MHGKPEMLPTLAEVTEAFLPLNAQFNSKCELSVTVIAATLLCRAVRDDAGKQDRPQDCQTTCRGLVVLLLMISVTHSTCGVLCTVSWRGVRARGCLNNFSGCYAYCKI